MMLDEPEVPPLTPTPCAEAAEAATAIVATVEMTMRRRDFMLSSILLMESNGGHSAAFRLHGMVMPQDSGRSSPVSELVADAQARAVDVGVDILGRDALIFVFGTHEQSRDEKYIDA